MAWYDINIKWLIKMSRIRDSTYWQIFLAIVMSTQFLKWTIFRDTLSMSDLIECVIFSYIIFRYYIRKPDHLWIIVIGLIGAGKSTACEECQNRDPKTNVYIEEPVGMWKDILRLFYNSFTKTDKETVYEPLLFQIVAFITRLFTIYKIYKATKHTRRVYFVDSCIEIDRKVYAQSLIDAGRIHGDQIQFYDLLYNLCFLMFPKSPNTKYIYLNTSIEKCINNKEVRGRDSEKTAVDRKYLMSLKERFDKFITTIPKDDIYTVSGDQDVESVTDDILKIVKKIESK